MARRRPRRSPQRLIPLLLRAVCIWGVAVALLPREGLSSKQLGADCFESCGYKSGHCPAVCPTTTRISGQHLVYTSYNCCRQGWHPHGECKISDGCVGRHCCVKGKESTQNPDAQASSGSSAEISTGQTNMADPTCTSGVVSRTGFVCSPASCGESDGSANCALRKGGDMCCSHKMLHSVGSCSLGPPPCVIEKSQRSKRTTPCPAAGFADASLELSTSLLQSYVSAELSARASMPFSLEGGATFTSGDQADVLDLTSAAATVMLRKSYQPSTVNRNQGFSVCMWFKADEVLSKSQSAYFPLASKFIENKGWELRLTLGGRVSFRVATELGPQFEVAVNVGSADAFSWHHVCGIHYGSSLSKAGILVDGSFFADHYLPVGTAKYMPVTSVRDTRIGRSLGDPRLKFQGMVAGFKVWADKAITVPEMQHIGGACGGGMNSPSNIAIGAQVNLYQDKEGTGHRLTDSSKVTCAKTFWNRYLPDLKNGKLDSVFAQIDLGQVRRINRVEFELDRVNLPPNWDHLVDVYVGNTGNRNYDTPCAVRANLESSTVVSCRRASIEATSLGTGLVHTGDDTDQRKYSSILSSAYSKGSLTSESGWRPKKDDIAPWTQVVLDGIIEVWGIMLDSCNVANPSDMQQKNPSYVTKFTVSYSATGEEGSFIPVDGGHVFRGLGFLVQEQFRRPFHWDIPVTARFVRVHPVAYNQDICMRFDVLRGPGRAEGRYVTVYAKSRLSLCEIEVYPEVAAGTGGRSAMCTPRSVQSSCLKPKVTDVKYSDLSLTKWNKQDSFLKSVSSVLDDAELERTGIDASICGIPRLQVRVGKGPWKLVKKIDDIGSEMDPVSIPLQRDIPLILPSYSSGEDMVGNYASEIRLVSCKDNPLDALSVLSEPRIHNFTIAKTESSSLAPSAPGQIGIVVSAEDSDTITIGIFLSYQPSGIDAYVLVVETHATLYFKSFAGGAVDFSSESNALQVRLTRDDIFMGRGEGTVKVYMFSCSISHGCSTPSQARLEIPSMQKGLDVYDTGEDPLTGSLEARVIMPSENGGAVIKSIKYRVVLNSDPDVLFTFDDVLGNSAESPGLIVQNWGSGGGWGEFRGPKRPDYFPRTGAGMATSFFGGPGHQLEIKNKDGKNGMVFGPPYTVAFWIRRDSDAGACVDVMSAVRLDSGGSEVLWDYISIFIWGHRNRINSQGNDLKAGHIVVQHQGTDYYRAHIGRISTEPLPIGEWKYVVVRAEDPSPWETRLNGERLQHIILTLSVLDADSGVDVLGDDPGVHWSLEANPMYINDREMTCTSMNSALCTPWRSPKKVHRRMFLGGQSMCSTSRGEVRDYFIVQDRLLNYGAEDGGGAAGFGGFSLSSFTLHQSKRTPADIIEELRHGLGYGSHVVSSPIQDAVTFSLADHVPAKFKGRVTVHTSVCNAFGCTPSISASLGPPSPPHAFNSSIDDTGKASLEFFTPMVSGGPPVNDVSYEYTAESLNAQCNMAELILDHPDIKPYVWAYFDASEARTVRNPSGTEAKEGDVVQEWHTFRGKKERFESSAWADSVGKFTRMGNEGKPGIIVGEKEGGVLSAAFHGKLPHNIEAVTKSYALYAVGSRSSTSGRFISTADKKNFLMGWYSTRVGVMHNGGWCNHYDKTKVWDTNWRNNAARQEETRTNGWYGPDLQTRVVSAQFDPEGVYYRTDYLCRGTKPSSADLDCKCGRNPNGYPGRLQFGGYQETRLEPAHGEINSMLLLLPNPPKESAHDLISAYMAWKWKKYAHWSDAEKLLFSQSNGCIFPNPASRCHMSLDTVEGAPATSSCASNTTSRVFFPDVEASTNEHFSRTVRGDNPSDDVYPSTHWRVGTIDSIAGTDEPLMIKSFDLKDVGGTSLLPADIYADTDASCTGVKARYLHIRGAGTINLQEIKLSQRGPNVIFNGGLERITQSSLSTDTGCVKGGQCDAQNCVDQSLSGDKWCKTQGKGTQWILVELKHVYCITEIIIINRQADPDSMKRKWITLWETKYEDPPAWEVTTGDCKERAAAGDSTNPCNSGSEEPNTYTWTPSGRSRSLEHAEAKGLLHSGWYDPLDVAYSDNSRDHGPHRAIDGNANTKWYAAGEKTNRHLAASERTKAASITYPVDGGGIWMGFAFETPQAVHSGILGIEGSSLAPGLALQRSTDGGVSWQVVGQLAPGSIGDTVEVNDTIAVQLPNSALRTRLRACNRFGCGDPAELELKPPPPATFVYVDVASSSRLSVAFRVPTAEIEKEYGSSSQSFTMHLGHSFPADMANLIKTIEIDAAAVEVTTGVISVDIDADGTLWDSSVHDAEYTRLWLRLHTCSILGCSDDFAQSTTGPPSRPSQLLVSIAGDHSVNVKIGYPLADNGLPASKYRITATIYNSSTVSANEVVKTVTEDLVPTGAANFASGVSISRAIDLSESVVATQRIRIEASACSSLGCTLVPLISWNVDMNASINQSLSYDPDWPDGETMVPTLSWSTTPNPSTAASNLAFTDPLALLFRFSASYESETWRTLKRMSNFEFLASGADIMRAPAEVHELGTGIWSMEATSEKSSHESDDLMAGTVLYEVLVSVPGEYELHAYTSCPDSDHNSWQIITQEGTVVRWDMATQREAGDSKSTWNIFSGGTWTVEYPGKKVWIELRVDEPGCLIERLLFNLEGMDNKLVRGRVWPPPEGTVVMQSYLSVPHSDTRSELNLTDLSSVFPFVGILPTRVEAQRCMLGVSLPPSDSKQGYMLSGGLYSKFYDDLQSKLPNIVKTVGWIGGSTDKVSAVGWNVLDLSAPCQQINSQECKTRHAECPLAATSCFTRHGPFAVGDTVYKEWDLSLVPHTAVEVSVRVWLTDSWDSEQLSILVDGERVFREVAHWETFNENGWVSFTPCSYQPWQGCRDKEAVTKTVKFNIPHTTDSIRVEFTSNLDSGVGDEAFLFDQFEMNIIPDLTRGAGLLSSGIPKAMSEEIEGKCSHVSGSLIAPVKVSPPTKITNVRVLNLALGAIKIGWDYPRSWGLHGADQERTFVVYFHGVVTGMGPDGSDGSEAVDETGDGSSDTNVTTLQHGIKYDITTTPETCMNCFNHTGWVVVRYPHIREVGLVNLHANTMYDITVRAATSEGGNGPLSDVLSEATLDQVGSPLKIIQEPLLVRADPESVELRWRVPDWQGSPITHIVVERSLVGMCGLEDVDWDFQYDPIPIDYRSFVNTPSPQFIVTSLDGLRSDTEYVFRAKTQNRALPAGLANQWSDCCTRSISTVSSSAFVDVSSQKGNDTLCSQNGRREEAADPEFCQTIHGALNYNRFEDVMLQLHQGHYSAHDSDGNAIKLWRPGMGIGGIAPDRTLVKIDCGGKTCVDITNKVNGEVVDVKACHEASLLSKSQRCTYPPSSFRKLTFLNASATSESAGRNEKRLDGAVIRLAGRFHPSFVGILIEDCIFENSFAEKQGGVIFADCLEAQQQLTLGISLRNVLFRNNAAQGAGGGAISLHHCKQVKLTQVTFESNHAPSGAGGAILASATDLRLDSVVAERNTAGGADGGGAFRVSGGSLTSENGGTESSSFPNKCAENSASLSSGAGGACLSLEYSSVSVVGWSMTHNQASLGGAIRCMGSRIQITDSVFHANTADRNGGALSGMLCETSIFRSVFSGNAAGTYDGLVEGSGRGGAIALEPGSSSTLVSSKFVDNTAKTYGGAYSCHSCDGGIVQFNTSFESNIAARGGGIALSETKIRFRGTADESALNTGSQWCTYDGLSIDNNNATHTLAYQTFQDQAAADNFMSQVSIGDELILVWGESALERPSLDDGVQNRIVGLVRIEGMRRDAPSSGDMSNAANGFVHFEFMDGVIPHNQGYDREAARAAILRDPINTFDVTRDEIAYAEMHAPSAEPSPRQIRDYIVYNQTRHANNGVLGCSLSLFRVVTGQYFRGNKATSSGGGALYWESSDRTDVPHIDPVKGAAVFGGNTARYGANFASMGKRIIPAHKTYTSFNTIPFRPALKLVDSYEQIVDQSQDEHFRPQTVTVFTRSQQKLFGKTTSVINETGWATLASLGMASEPGRQNCTFFASSAKVFEARVQVSIRNCGAGDFLRNTASQVRTIYEEWHSSKGFDEYATSTAGMTYTNYAKLWEKELGTVSSSEIQTMFAALDDDEDGMIQAEEIVSRFDSHVPCVADGQKQICTWECSACPTGRFSANDTERGSRRSCSVCPLGFVQPETGENECLKCEIGKFSASLGGVECKLNAIDALLPNNFVGLRFLATPKFEAATVVIKWDVPIDPTIDSQGVTTSRTDIVGIQVRLSLGNGGRFEEKLIAEKVIPIDHTNATFDMSRPAVDVGCRRANAGNPCLPPHLMKYYTRVRVYTDTGFMGESAFPLKVWSIATECSEREYLDDYSCPSCESMRAEIIALLEENPSDTQSNYRLKALPSEDTVTRASAPGERLLNPLTWECVECPDGAMCRGDVLYGGIISKFGNWRVEKGTRPETFERCFYPPACLGAPNTDFAGRYYDGKCTEQCRADCDTPKNTAKDGFDLDDCRYKCGFDSYCDRALVEITDCGATAVWGKGTYNGDSPSLWPGASPGNALDDEPLLVINHDNYKISLDLDVVAAGESRTGIQDCKASALEFGRDLNVWQNRHMSSGDAEGAKTFGDGFHIQTQPILPYPRGPGPCGDDGAYFGFAWGERASATPFIIESTPQYALTAQPPDVMWDHSANGGKSTAQAQFYHDNNGTVWNDVMNSSRICRAFRWADTEPSEEPTCPDSIETMPPAGEGGGMWEDISCQICPSGPNDPWGQWDKRSCEFDSNHGCTPQWEGPFTDRRPGKNRRQLNLLKISGEWMIYDYEIVPFWNNVSRTRYTQLRGFVYSSFSEDRGSESAAASPKPKIKHHFEHEGAMQIQIMMDMSHSKVLKATVQKTKVQLCHMGHLDNAMLIDQDSGGAGDSTEMLFTRCDRSKGLICERCDVEMGYMQDCTNPAGSRCRLCTSCAANFKRSGEARCKRCPESSTNRALLVLGVLAMIVAGAGLIYMAIEAADALDNVSDAMKKIMINYLQVTSLAAGFPLKWPEAVEQMFAAMSAVSSAGQHVLSPDCELSSMEPAAAFYAKQIMFASIPLVVFVISKMVWGGLKLFHVAYIHHARTMNGGKAACRACKSCVVLRPAVYYVDRSVLTDVVFFYFLYPTMVKQAIALFACDEVGGVWYLSADLQEECFVGRHLSWMSLIGIPQLIVYVVGMPLLSWTILMANRWRLHKKRVRFRYGMLYSGYRRQTFWWEGVVAMRKVVFVAIAGVFGSRMGPDLQCFVALFILFWFFNFHLTAHPFDEITARHRVLHHIETWALIVGWCTMWMGLIFYLGNEYGRINRGWMVFFTITIIGINVVYSAVVMVLFCKEYHLERIEARVAQSQEQAEAKLAAHMYMQERILHNMGDAKGNVAVNSFRRKMSARTLNPANAEAEKTHRLNPRKVGRNSLGKKDRLKIRRQVGETTKDNLEIGMQNDMDDAAAFLLKPNLKNDQAHAASKAVTGGGGGSRTAVMPIDVNPAIRMQARRLKQRLLERKMGLTPAQAAHERAVSRFERLRLEKLKQKRNQSERVVPQGTEFIQVKMWGTPTGIKLKFVEASKGEYLVKKVKHGASICPAEGRSRLKEGDCLIDVNGKDIRGLSHEESDRIYKMQLKEAGGTSISEDPPMWYMIFRRGMPMADEMKQSPLELVQQGSHKHVDTGSESIEARRERERVRDTISSGITINDEETHADASENKFESFPSATGVATALIEDVVGGSGVHLNLTRVHATKQQEEQWDDTLPPGWVAHLDPSSGHYYYQGPHGTTQWHKPEQPATVLQSTSETKVAAAAAEEPQSVTETEMFQFLRPIQSEPEAAKEEDVPRDTDLEALAVEPSEPQHSTAIVGDPRVVGRASPEATVAGGTVAEPSEGQEPEAAVVVSEFSQVQEPKLAAAVAKPPESESVSESEMFQFLRPPETVPEAQAEEVEKHAAEEAAQASVSRLRHEAGRSVEV